MSMRPRKAIPAFRSEREERQFWESHDTGSLVDWSTAQVAVFPNLKPSTETISLRLPSALLAELKALANKRDVPYQSLLKVFLADRVSRETHLATGLPGRTQHMSRAKRRSPSRKSARAARG
jgi:predicted DNA binding CopG/RHH family protein